EIPTGDVKNREQLIQYLESGESTIQIASSSIGTETYFKANSDIRFMVVGVSRETLNALLQVNTPNKQVQTILDSRSTFFFHEQMTADIQRIVKKLFQRNDRGQLNNLFYRIKIQKLI